MGSIDLQFKGEQNQKGNFFSQSYPFHTQCKPYSHIIELTLIDAIDRSFVRLYAYFIIPIYFELCRVSRTL